MGCPVPSDGAIQPRSLKRREQVVDGQEAHAEVGRDETLHRDRAKRRVHRIDPDSRQGLYGVLIRCLTKNWSHVRGNPLAARGERDGRPGDFGRHQ